jgi:MurNAc alpha-1-phosphate uridylyltransferase
MMVSMRVMILAAGRGERMRPLTDHMPKPLLPVADKPLIVWHIEALARAGFEDIVINHAYLGEQIEQALGDGSRWGVKLHYSPEGQALETAGGIAYALHLLGNAPFLVVNGDVFCHMDFAQMRLNAPDLAHLVMVPNPAQHPQGDFGLKAQRVSEQEGERLTFSGVGVYHPDLFKSIVRGESAKLAPLLRLAMQQGLVSGEKFTGTWHDIGTPQRLQEINTLLDTQVIKNPD